jgi:signal transduction histidine kinase
VRKDGTVIDVNVDWNYKFDESGELNGFIAVVTDVTH